MMSVLVFMGMQRRRKNRLKKEKHEKKDGRSLKKVLHDCRRYVWSLGFGMVIRRIS